MRSLIAIAILSLPTLASAATCPNATDLLSVGPAAATGTTVGSSDDYFQTCGGVDGADEAYEFMAPLDGRYTFDTIGSVYDTVLQALAADCTTSLECDDDGAAPQSILEVDMLAGERVVIVVEGYNDLEGDYVLNVAAEPLPVLTCDLDDDVGSATGFDAFAIDTCGLGDNHNPSCGQDLGGEDALLSWTAPSAGVFTFSTAGTDFDTVLSIASDTCDPEFMCNDDTSGLQSSVTGFLSAGETIRLRVDGYDDLDCGVVRLHVLESDCLDENMNARCDQDDAWLTLSAPVAGGTMDMEVTNAIPGSDVTFYLAKGRQTTPVFCHELSDNDCKYLINPGKLPSVVADANGFAQVSLVVPQRFAGTFVYAQALSETATDARATSVVYDYVQ